MAQVRNVSNDKLRVPHVSRVVEPDDLLEVLDIDFVDRTWHRDLWDLVEPPAAEFHDQSSPDAIWFSTDPPEPASAPDTPEPEPTPSKPGKEGADEPAGDDKGQE